MASSLVNTELLSLVSKAVNDLSTDMGISFKKLAGLEYTIECEEDRVATQEELEMHVENMIPNIKLDRVTKSDSIDHTVVSGYGKTLRIVYKLRSGGMSETTLNSTITELFPAVAWDQNLPVSLNETKFAQESLMLK